MSLSSFIDTNKDFIGKEYRGGASGVRGGQINQQTAATLQNCHKDRQQPSVIPLDLWNPGPRKNGRKIMKLRNKERVKSLSSIALTG